jgi:hypothetical protein
MGDISHMARHLEVDATGRDRVHGWLSVGYHISGVSRPGRVGHSDPQRPSTGSIWRPISRTTGGVGFCPLNRAVGVNPRSSLRYTMRSVVVVPQHQTAMYDVQLKKLWSSIRKARYRVQATRVQVQVQAQARRA